MNSDQVKSGVERAPHRSLLKADGYSDEQIRRPFVGVVNSFNEIAPGHVHLQTIARAVKDGVLAAGGTPMEFNTIGVCDGIAMGHKGMHFSLSSRELIADTIECMVSGHCFDGLVFIPNCDKIVPGMLMAALRLNLPCIFVSGGPMLSIGQRDLNSVFEAVGARKAGLIGDGELAEIEGSSCPGCGSCSGMFTANSMNCLTEAIGMGLRGNGTIPAVWSARLRLAKHAGMQIMELVAKNIRPRDIMTPAAFHNAETVDMALGCSTNSALHLPAIAHEAGISINLHMINEISEKTPNLCHLAPAGPTHMPDLYAAGGIPAVQAELAKRGIEMLDAPVSGGEPKAIDGTLSFMVGGKQEVFDQYKDILGAMGTSVVRCGDVGAGNTTKLANQIIVACNIQALAEALTLAKMAGVDPELVFQAIRGGLAGSTVMNAKAPMMIEGNDKPGFKIDLHIKDLNNALDCAHTVGSPLPMTAAVQEIFQWLHNNGCGQDDHSSIIKYYKKLTGIESL